METVGIVCEYNPLHLGHKKQFDIIRHTLGEETAIVCVMSGNYVQRGHPAIFHKSLRARAAVLAGADLVLEMPITTSLSSAEGFAAGSVSVLGKFCDRLCFGAENADADGLMDAAHALLSPDFPVSLRTYLDAGLSFPAARQKALEQMNISGDLLSCPNNILAVEYCKAILDQKLAMQPMPIFRDGSYHDTTPDPENPSATSLRQRMDANEPWLDFVPDAARPVFSQAGIHTLQAGERAVLAKLRSMTDDEFEALPYGSEGLWRKLMHAARTENSLDAVASAVKSKRYTRSRIDRMILCAFLGITNADITTPAPYARVLALNKRGSEVLKNARNFGSFPNAGEKTGTEYELLEQRCNLLYGLFSRDRMIPRTPADRVIYLE